MKALCYQGLGRVAVENVPDPEFLGPHDAIVKVTMSSVCGSDLHLFDGYIPTMKQGDIIGHEFVGEVVEVASDVRKIRPGMRVVVGSIIGCGHCYFCQSEMWSLCDNTNPNPEIEDKAYGYATAGIYGYSHAFGGYAGSHAQYIRVPFADENAFEIPEGLPDEKVVFASDAIPTGYMGADMCNIRSGDVVAIWGCGGVGQMAIRSAYLLGAERVIAIDRFADRLEMAQILGGAEILDYEQVDVHEALREMTGGRGPDACIDAVGMEAHGIGIDYAYDRVKQAVRLETDRPTALRQAIRACRKGGTVSIMGVYGGFIDKFPIGAAMNKGLTLRMGQQHGQKYIPRILEHIQRGDLDPSYLITQVARLEDGQSAYESFRDKQNGCVRVVFTPQAAAA